MRSCNIRVVVTLVLLCALTPYLMAVGPVIGFVMANGSLSSNTGREALSP